MRFKQVRKGKMLQDVEEYSFLDKHNALGIMIIDRISKHSLFQRNELEIHVKKGYTPLHSNEIHKCANMVIYDSDVRNVTLSPSGIDGLIINDAVITYIDILQRAHSYIDDKITYVPYGGNFYCHTQDGLYFNGYEVKVNVPYRQLLKHNICRYVIYGVD